MLPQRDRRGVTGRSGFGSPTRKSRTLPGDTELFDVDSGNAWVNQTFVALSLGAYRREAIIIFRVHCNRRSGSPDGRERVLCFRAKGRRPSASSIRSIPAVAIQPAAPQSQRDRQQGRTVCQGDHANRQRKGSRPPDQQYLPRLLNLVGRNPWDRLRRI